MQGDQLRRTLHAFVEEASWQLASETAHGDEIPFEVIGAGGAGGRRTPLYCYRPLTDEFIRGHAGPLVRLPSYPAAAQALEGVALDQYLRARGEQRIPSEPRERADAALRTLLSDVFEGASEFVFSEERFVPAFQRLEAAGVAGRVKASVVAPLLGLSVASAEVPLGDGLTLVRGETWEGAPEDAVWASAGDRANVLAVLAFDGAEPGDAPLTSARTRLRRLLTALRLWDGGVVALGPAAWTRVEDGAWRMVPLGTSGRAHGICAVPAEQEDELRAFCNLVARRAPRGGELAWALSRFEMGCERIAPFEALTDYLLALRALLEPEGPGSGRLAGRLAAICALPERRAALAERVAHAISLERAVIAGLAPAEPGVDALVDELGGHLRAVLRDVICGHLDSDVRAVADELIESGAAVAFSADDGSGADV